MKEYYTVNEFSEITGQDTGNIRRMLIYGLLAGEKIGRQWLIPKDAEYPSDGRVKSGEYKNWRKRAIVNKAAPGLMNELTRMSEKIAAIYGESLERVILYGSYARGEQTDESDVDVAVLLKGKDSKRKHDKMIDLVVDYELDLALTLSVISIDYSNYQQWNKNLPFYKNIEKEGIVLWKTA